MRADNPPQPIVLGVVILGAGASARMGRPKLLLPWGATSVLGHLIHQWRTLRAEQIAVVCADSHEAIHAELNRLGFPKQDRVTNPAPESGMFSSIQCAARWPGWKAGLTHWTIVLGDQPHLQTKTLRALIDFGSTQPQRVCQPNRNGRARHPVLLPRSIFQELCQATEENLKQFLQNRTARRALCGMDDAGLDFDIDEPADYERAVQRFLKEC